MKTPLNETLERLRGHISFHTPGYQPMQNKRRGDRFFLNGVFDYDVTELPTTDNLLSPVGVIAESERALAQAYGAQRTTFLTAGATAGIYILIYALAQGGKALVVGNAHASVYHALRAASACAFHCSERGFSAAMYSLHPDVVIVTSPDYFGSVAPLAYYAGECEKGGAKLIVDAAHGAHFPFCSLLPENALKFTPYVVHSLHKTMPVPTGTALAHFSEESEERVTVALNLFHTTSPFYPAMAAAERAVEYLSERGEGLYRNLFQARNAFEKAFRYTLLERADFSRFVLRFPFHALRAQEELARAKIQVEYVHGNEMALIITPFNVKWLPEVAKVLNNLEFPAENEEKEIEVEEGIRELKFTSSFECVEPRAAVGRLSYWEAGFYPPGVPLLVSGERIDERKAKLLELGKDRAFGLVKGKIVVVK